MRLKCHCCPNELCYASVKGRNLRRLKLVPGRTNINHRRFHLESSMQHFQSDFAVVSANGIRDRGAKAQGGTPCTRVCELDPICGHDLLPVRTCTVAAGNHRQKTMATNWVQLENPRAWRSALCF